MAIAALGVDDNDPITHHLVQATLDLARGLALADVLTDDSVRREKVVRAWADTMATALPPSTSRWRMGRRVVKLHHVVDHVVYPLWCAACFEQCEVCQTRTGG